ncbi:MAG: HtaA domain-containing protein [Salana multivorans]|nr:HtaA domain-containing protein [Salana multivorans]
MSRMLHPAPRLRPDGKAGAATRWLAALVTSALVALGAIVGIAVPASAADYTLSGIVTEKPGDGLTVDFTGSGFDDIAFLPGQTEPHVYVAFVKVGEWTVDQATTPNGSFTPSADGTLTGTLSVPVATLDRTASYDLIAWPSRSNPAATNNYARSSTLDIDWTALFPPTPATTSLALDLSATEVVEGTDVTATATVSPAVAGTVTFTPGGSATVSEGVASVTLSDLPVGTTAVEASFVPADPDAYAGSSAEPRSVVVTAKPTEPTFDPKITVTPNTDLDPAGATVTVTGTGFNPAQPIYVTYCKDVPLEDVSFGFISAGCTSGAKQVTSNPTTPTQVKFNEDGSFETTLAIAPRAEGQATAVYTLANHTAMNDRTQDAKATVTFKAPTPTFDPAIQVFLADGTTPYTGQSMEPGDTLVVKGTGFDPAANVGGMGQPIPANLPQGTFVVFGNFSPTWKPSEGAASSARQSTTASRVWALAESVLDQVPTAFQPAIRASWADIAEDGSFTATVTLQNPTTLATDGAWGIYTYPGGVGTPANPAQELSVPVTYEPAGSTDPEPQPGPRVTVTPRTLDVTVENVVTVSGTGFTGPGAANGAYVVLGETSLWSGNGPLPGAGWDVLAWVMPTQITDGAFSVTLTVPAGKLDPTKAYQVATSAAHALSATNRSLDTFTSLVVHGTPVETPDLALAITQDGAPVTSVVQGSTVSITGTGFAAGEQVSAVVTSDPVALGERTADANGTVTFEWTVPADFEATAHTVTLTGATSGSVEGSLTVTEASGEPQEPAVCDATFAWGIKSSFRTYLARDFVNGSITTSGGVTQRADNGIFDWSAQAGDLDLDAGTGSVTFPGSVRFTGHEGALDLTFTNVTFRLTSPTTAQIVVDYTGREFVGMNPGDLGSEISGTGIVLADVTFEKSSTAEAVTITGPATLAASGAEAFGGFYTAGEELDAFALVVPLTNECGETPNPGTPGGNEPTPTPTEDTPAPTTPATPAQCVPVPASAVKAGAPGTASLSWGVKTSFRNYVTGPIANGSISGSTTFYGSPGSITTTNRTGTASFGGSVSFSGHDGALSLHISNPSVKITSATSAQLVASVSSKGYNGSGGLNGTVVLATVSLPSPSASGDSITWRGAGVTLTAEGAKAFGGFYSAGESMDSLTLTVTPAVAGSIDTAGLPALADGAVYCDDLASTGAGSTDGLGLAAVALLALGVVLVATRRRSLIGG